MPFWVSSNKTPNQHSYKEFVPLNIFEIWPVVVMHDCQLRSHNQSMDKCACTDSLPPSLVSCLSVSSEQAAFTEQDGWHMTQVYKSLTKGAKIFFWFHIFLVLTWSELITAHPAVPITWHTQQHTHARHSNSSETQTISSVCSKLALNTGTQRNLLHRLLQCPRRKDDFTCSAMHTTATRSDLEYTHLLKLRI